MTYIYMNRKQFEEKYKAREVSYNDMKGAKRGTVWSVVENENGKLWIENGLRFTNVVSYFISERLYDRSGCTEYFISYE